MLTGNLTLAPTLSLRSFARPAVFVFFIWFFTASIAENEYAQLFVILLLASIE